MSGHSKWATIHRKKGLLDAARGKVFQKLAKEIMVAAKAGSPDPSQNAALRMVIDKMMNNHEEERLKRIKSLKIVAMFVCCIILSVGVSYAKEIKELVKTFFNNTNSGISVAVDNDFVQYNDSDFVYFNDIGIKVNAIVLDKIHCNISYLFENKINNENVKAMRIRDYTIRTDYGRIFHASEIKYANDLNEVSIVDGANWFNRGEKVDNNRYTDSVLYGLRETDKEIKKLIFEINSIDKILEDETVEIIDGKWCFEVEINEDMKPKIIEYTLKENVDGIKNAFATLNPTGLNCTIELDESIDIIDYALNTQDSNGVWGLFTVLKNNDKFIASKMGPANNEHSAWNLTFDNVTSFDQIEELKIFIENLNKTIILIKKDV